MKNYIPIRQLTESVSGVRIEKVNATFISNLFNNISKPHRNDHFICLMLISGRAELLVDFKKVHVSQAKIAFLPPGHIQKVIRFEKDTSGWILFLDNKLVDDHARIMIEDSLVKGPVLSLSRWDLEWFTRYFELLYQTCDDHSLGSLDKTAVNALAAPGICKIASAFHSKTASVSAHHSPRSIELTRNLRRFAKKNYRDLKKPADYAALLNVSVTYLNDTIKSVTGFTTSYFIQQEVLRESQRLLCYTDLSIKEIAGELGYNDSKYFNRLFTNLTKVSPGRFRDDFKSLDLKKVSFTRRQ